MTNLVNINVSVPEEHVGSVYAYVAELITGGTSDGSSKALPRKDGVRAKNGFGRDTVRRNYLGGQSDYWRPFLEELSEHPDEWVAWADLCKAIQMTPQQASGMLGAAERRCKLKPPYEKAWEDDVYWFRMPGDVAEQVRELAAVAHS